MYVTTPSEHFDQFVTPIVSDMRPRNIGCTFKPGRHLFREGDKAKRVYQVVSGVLRLTRVMENGRRQVIAFGYPGDVIGFPNGTRHHTDCEVIKTAQVIAHSRDILENGDRDSVLHQQLIHAALREISNMQDHFMTLGRTSASERIASFLCVQARRIGDPLGNYTRVSLPMSRSDIADFLGLTVETVSRTITQLCKSGLILRENVHTIIIVRPAALQALANDGDDPAPAGGHPIA